MILTSVEDSEQSCFGRTHQLLVQFDLVWFVIIQTNGLRFVESKRGLKNQQCRSRKAKVDTTFFSFPSKASIAANRISFCLGLEGVSVTVDTACSSTLVALDMSIQRLGDMEAVLCSGSQLNLIAVSLQQIFCWEEVGEEINVWCGSRSSPSEPPLSLV